jgi:hypothetical protein
VQLAGEQRDAVGPRVVAKPMAGDAHLAATAGLQYSGVEVRPLLYRVLTGRLGPGEGGGRHPLLDST